MKDKNGILRLGSGSSSAEDRLDHAVELLQKVDLDYLCMDALAENETSLIEVKKEQDPTLPGYDLWMQEKTERIIMLCLEKKVKYISNLGNSNPIAAAKYVCEVAEEHGFHGIKVAAVTGDNVLSIVKNSDFTTMEEGIPCKQFGDNLIAASAYIGAEPIVEALKEGADVVITGRCGDSCLYLAPLVYEYGWKWDDWDNLAKGIFVGHIMECGAQCCGGYFSDPPYKDVPAPWRIGFPYCEITKNGDTIDVVVTKAPGTGGQVTVDTCKEQTLYEVHDPENYIHPDVVCDLSHVAFKQVGYDRVQIVGTIKGKPATPTYKIVMGVKEGFRGFADAAFGGPGALSRAKWAREVLYRRFDDIGIRARKLKIYILGYDGMYAQAPGVPKNPDPWEVLMRTAIVSDYEEDVYKVLCEGSNSLTTNGPAAMACSQRSTDIKPVVGNYSLLLPKELVHLKNTYWEVK